MTMEKFHFEHDGIDYEMPYFSNLKIGVQNRLLKAMAVKEESWRLATELVEMAGEEAGEAIEDMYMEELSEVVKTWLQATPGVPGK